MEKIKNDKSNSSLVRNSALNTLYHILSVVLPIFTAPYVSRVLMADGIGVSSYTHSLVSYFTIVAALGTVSYGTMKISKQRKDKASYSKAFWEIELLTIISSLICFASWIVLAFLYVEYKIYLLVLSFNILAVMFDISWLYSGLEKFHYTISINSLFKIACVVCVFVFIKNSDDLFIYIMISSLSVLLGNLSMWLFLPKTICKTKIDFGNLKHHFKQTLVFFAPTIATSIYTILDKTLIGVLIPGTITIVDSEGNEIIKKIAELENGYYEQATKLINIIKSVSFVGIIGVMTSHASYLYEENDQQQVKKLLHTTFNIISFLTIGAGFGISAIATTLIPTFFGTGYDSTISIIYILSCIPFIISISNILGGMYYTPSGRRKQSSLFLIIGASINLLLNIPLILLLKAKGAAIASIIAETFITLLYVINCKKMLSFKEIFSYTWKKMVAGFIMFTILFCFTFFFHNSINNFLIIPLQLFAGLLIYCLVLLILRDKSLNELILFFHKKYSKRKEEVCQQNDEH